MRQQCFSLADGYARICVINGCYANNFHYETCRPPISHSRNKRDHHHHLQLPSIIIDLRMDVRREIYDHLGRMKMAFENLPTPYVNNSDLSTFGVQLSQMSLHPEHTIDFGPHFCTPFPAHEFDQLFEKVEKLEWDKPGPPGFNCNYYEGLGLAQWFILYLGSKRFEWQLLASSKWTEQV
jgi:hypothetical protein